MFFKGKGKNIMRPIPIPDGMAEAFEQPAERKVIAAPNGDLTNPDIAPLEAVYQVTDQGFQIHALIKIEEADFETLKATEGRFWLTFWTPQIPAFSLWFGGLEDEGKTEAPEEGNEDTKIYPEDNGKT